MKFVRSVTDVFGYSPFEDLHRHAELCGEAVEKLIKQFQACIDGDFDRVKSLEKEIDSMEYEADKIKHEIRGNVTKSLLMPVDRQDLLQFLKVQDSIIDNTEHVAHMLSYRKFSIDGEIWEPMMNLLRKIEETVREYERLVDHMKNLIATSFSKKEIRDTIEHVPVVEELEHQCDKIQIEIHRKIFNSTHSSVMELILLNEIVVKLGEIANSAARSADAFRSMILGR